MSDEGLLGPKIDQLAKEMREMRAEGRAADERIASRVTTVEQTVEQIRKIETSRTNAQAELLERVRRVENESRRFDDVTGRVMAELGTVTKRLGAQDAELATQTKAIAEVETETKAQTTKLDTLLDADEQRRQRESIAAGVAAAIEKTKSATEQATKARMDRLMKWLQIAVLVGGILSAIGGIALWFITHYRSDVPPSAPPASLPK